MVAQRELKPAAGAIITQKASRVKKVHPSQTAANVIACRLKPLVASAVGDQRSEKI
jgi:hypothetical protein